MEIKNNNYFFKNTAILGGLIKKIFNYYKEQYIFVPMIQE